MSSRGSLAKNGHVTNKDYETIRITENGVKILNGIGNNHSLPELSHSPNSIYAKLKDDGTLHELRFFNSEGYPVFEIANHPEPRLNGGDRKTNVLHIHTFDGMNRNPAMHMDNKTKVKYYRYLKEFDLI